MSDVAVGDVGVLLALRPQGSTALLSPRLADDGSFPADVVEVFRRLFPLLLEKKSGITPDHELTKALDRFAADPSASEDVKRLTQLLAKKVVNNHFRSAGDSGQLLEGVASDETYPPWLRTYARACLEHGLEHGSCEVRLHAARAVIRMRARNGDLGSIPGLVLKHSRVQEDVRFGDAKRSGMLASQLAKGILDVTDVHLPMRDTTGVPAPRRDEALDCASASWKDLPFAAARRFKVQGRTLIAELDSGTKIALKIRKQKEHLGHDFRLLAYLNEDAELGLVGYPRALAVDGKPMVKVPMETIPESLRSMVDAECRRDKKYAVVAAHARPWLCDRIPP